MGKIWKKMKKLLGVALGGLGAAALAVGGLRLLTTLAYHDKIYSTAEVPTERVAVVFGAGLLRSGLPTPVLYDRVAVAAELYRLGKVQKLLLSGDNRFLNYNEPGAMRKTALSLGVPESDLVLDYAGRSTYDTCYRAKAIFGLTRATLVTQNFHLPRALLTCEALGIQAVGVSSDLHNYGTAEWWWSFRETLATANAWVEVTLTHPVPVLGDPLPIQ
jgi:SanA protein